jgi:hypothetical protein
MPSIGFQHVCLLAAFVASMAFILGYSAVAPWWRYPVGRTVVSLDFAVAFSLLPGVLRIWFGVPVNTAFFAWYYCVSLLLVAGITLWRLLTIYELQQHGREELHHQQEEEA